MTRHTALYVLAALILIVGAIVFAFTVDNESDPIPRYAFSNDEAMNRPGGSLIRDAGGLVPVQIDRAEGHQIGTLWLGLLLWLPVSAAFVTLGILFQTHPQATSNLLWVLVLGAASAILSCGESAWSVGAAALAGIALVAAGATPIDSKPTPPAPQSEVNVEAGETPPPPDPPRHTLANRLHVVVVAALLISAMAMSLTTHRLFAVYCHFAPGAQDLNKLETTLFDTLSYQKPPTLTKDVLGWRMSLIPALNRFSFRVTLFGVNRIATILFLWSCLFYMYVWVVILPQYWRRDRASANDSTHVPKHGFRLFFSLVFYLAVGAGFAINYYNIYICAAAKQNVMLLYAAYTKTTDDQYQELQDAFRKLGWRESLEQQILNFRSRGQREDLSSTVAAVRAQYWPSTIIAQETPHSGVDFQNRPETRMALEPLVTLHDMLYFSFSTFTTTGYGDIRPVSDQLRFWSVVENIMELLFTAMFFVVAMEIPKQG